MREHPSQTGEERRGGGVLFGAFVVVTACLVALFAGGSAITLIAGGLQHSFGWAKPEVEVVAGEQQSEVLPAEGVARGAEDSVAAAPPGAAPDLASMVTEGGKIYAASCMACHQPTGQGVPGVFPPVAGSDWVCGENADCAIAVVLGGLQGPITVNGQPFSTAMAMPPHGPMLDDHKIAAVLTYIRNSWGQQGAAVSPARVAELRGKFGSRTGFWTQEELHQAVHAAHASAP